MGFVQWYSVLIFASSADYLSLFICLISPLSTGIILSFVRAPFSLLKVGFHWSADRLHFISLLDFPFNTLISRLIPCICTESKSRLNPAKWRQHFSAELCSGESCRGLLQWKCTSHHAQIENSRFCPARLLIVSYWTLHFRTGNYYSHIYQVIRNPFWTRSTTATKVKKVSNKQKLGNLWIIRIGWKIIILHLSLIHILLHILNFSLIVTCQVGLCHRGATLPAVWTQRAARALHMKLAVNMLNDSCNLEAGRKAKNSRQKTPAHYEMLHKLGLGHISWNDLDQRFSTFVSWTDTIIFHIPRNTAYENVYRSGDKKRVGGARGTANFWTKIPAIFRGIFGIFRDIS